MLEKQKNKLYSQMTDYSKMSHDERFELIYSQKTKDSVYDYLNSRFENLKIEIYGDYEGQIMTLMKMGVLEGWCWETTETAILFLNDDDYIERGNLKFDDNYLYYHSWIIFTYNNVEYVFDPCLAILCEKNIYDKVFEIEVKGKVTSKQVKNYFINYITNQPKNQKDLEEEKASEYFRKWLRNNCQPESLDKTEEVIIPEDENVNSPMYRNGVGYKTTLEDNKVKKLIAHYYYKGCA